MLTGRLPFEGDTPLSIAVQHRSDHPIIPQEYNAQIPDDLCRAILKCMEKDKGERYQTAEEFLSSLISMEQGIPTTERVTPKVKPKTSKEVTVSLSPKRLIFPAIVVIVIAIIGLFLWHPWLQKESPTMLFEKPSIAVLPFEDYSPQQDQEYRCFGIAAELINRLIRIQDLWVPARASSFSFGAKNINIKEVGDKLGVKTVLLGTIQKEEKKLLISVELVNIADNATIWQHTYPHDEGDLLDLLDEISLAIVDTLKVSLLGEEKSILTKRYTENVEAYNLYLQGRFFWDKRTEEGLNQAKIYFENAIAADPNFALGYAGLADVFNILGSYLISPQKEVSPKLLNSILVILLLTSGTHGCC
jgi:TolB-like protein